MQKTSFLFVLLVAIAACEKDELPGSTPECIKEKIESTPPNSVRTMQVGGGVHFWFETGARHADGLEYILNGNCDTVCIVCSECNPPDCLSAYSSGLWETIWEK